MDHLFVDQHGVPTLVEVKRSSDTRIRREVVGQMLEYASHAAAYWPVEQLRSAFEARCRESDSDPEETLASLLSNDDPDFDADGFWDGVSTNLRLGRIRLLFVADVIPKELRHIVEFLNEQMNPAEVMAIELRRFSGDTLTAIVPTVLGITAKGDAKHATGRKFRQWDEESFMSDIEQRHGADALQTAKRLLEWFKSMEARIWWGKGITEASFVPVVDTPDNWYALLRCGTAKPSVQVYFWIFKERNVLDEEQRDRLRQALNRIKGVQIPESGIDRYPSFPLMALSNDAHFELFASAYQQVLDAIRSIRSTEGK